LGRHVDRGWVGERGDDSVRDELARFGWIFDVAFGGAKDASIAIVRRDRKTELI